MLRKLFKKLKGENPEPHLASSLPLLVEPELTYPQERFLSKYDYYLQPNSAFLTYLGREIERSKGLDKEGVSSVVLLDLDKFIVSKLDDDFLVDATPIIGDLSGPLLSHNSKRGPDSIYPYLRRPEELDIDKGLKDHHREVFHEAGIRNQEDLTLKGKKHLALLLEEEILGRDFIDYLNSDLAFSRGMKRNRESREFPSYKDFPISPLSIHTLALLFGQYLYRAHKERFPGSILNQDELDYLIREIIDCIFLGQGALFFHSLEDLSYHLKFKTRTGSAPDLKDLLLFHCNYLSYKGLSLEEFNEHKDFFRERLENSALELFAFSDLKEISTRNRPYKRSRHVGEPLWFTKTFIDRHLLEPELILEIDSFYKKSKIQSFSRFNDVTIFCETMRAFLEYRYPIFRDRKGYGAEFLDTFLFYLWIDTCKDVLEELIDLLSIKGLDSLIYRFGMTEESVTYSPEIEVKRSYLESHLRGQVSQRALKELPIFTGSGPKMIDLLMEYLDNEDSRFLEEREDYSDLHLIDAGLLYRVLQGQL